MTSLSRRRQRSGVLDITCTKLAHILRKLNLPSGAAAAWGVRTGLV